MHKTNRPVVGMDLNASIENFKQFHDENQIETVISRLEKEMGNDGGIERVITLDYREQVDGDQDLEESDQAAQKRQK